MWAAYFLPQWISRHEESSGKAIERYKNAMQVVADNNKKISRRKAHLQKIKNGRHFSHL